MALLLQLRLLLWKNCVYRRRQKFRCAIELIWPLCLFLLLMWVRTKGFHKRMHQCNFEEKPLPSSGQLLFYQGALCAFNNTCHKYPTQAIRDHSSESSSKFNEILEDAKIYAETTVDGNKTRLNSFAISIRNLAEELSKIPLQDEHANLMEKNLTKNKMDRIIKLHHKLDESIQEMKPIVKLIGLLDKIDNNYDNLTELIKEAPFLDEFFIRLHTYVCGNNSNITLDMLLDTKNEYYGFDYFLDINKFPTTLHYEYDEESSEICNELYEKLETTPSLKMVWHVMKPFVKGKLVYSPNTTVIRRIVDRVRTLMMPLSLPNFVAERESLSMDPIVYLEVVKNLNVIKDYLWMFHKQKNIEDINYILQQEFYETVFKAENIIQRFDEKYRNLQTSNVTLSEILQCYNQRDFEGYSTEKEAEQRSIALCDRNDLLAQISFEDENENNLSSLVSYKIRLNSERMPHPNELSTFSLSSGPGYRPMYDLKLVTFGFIYIQDLFEKSIIAEVTGREISPGLVLKQMPHPCYIQDWFMSSLSDMFPLFMVLCWVYTSSMIVKSIVHEKEQKLKETMCVLGLNNTIYWCSWFIDSIIPMSITVCLLSVILVYGGILANADITLVMVFLMIFAVATINQSFLLSVCFSKANQAASSSGVIYFISYLPFPFIEQWYPHFSPVSKLIACSLSNVALGLGSQYFSMRESEGTGCKWSNVAASPMPGDRFNLLLIMFILIFDSTIYLLLAWYLENVFPGSYGMPKPWNFPFKKSYWCTQTVKDSQFQFEDDSDYRNNSSDGKLENNLEKHLIEPTPEHLKIGVSITNLSKTYKNNVVAISNLNINFYEDQITAFLGRNGAGKTTTISILTGLFPPSSGTAKIYGLDVRTSISCIRQNLGICPQYNLYFNCFTVEEHLWFFARLKGHSPGEAQVEIQQILQDLGLSNKKQCLASYLSGGMKRKLSVAIAFIGGSRTVILDEPTAGVDPYSRIGIWDLIQKNKKGRTIILTTHMMSEAELLGDRIAIFANGDLLCCGSSSFLKSNFGWGIVLTVDLGRLNSKEDDTKVKELTESVNSIIPGTNVIDTFGTEIKFNLPKADGNIENYHELFNYLEKNRSNLGINTYGIADTSLEEIFMKMVGDHDKKDDGSYNEKAINEMKIMKFSITDKGKSDKYFFKQFIALLHKRFQHFKRSKLILALEIILPILFVCVCMLVTNKLPTVQHPQAYVVDISNCSNCTSFFEILPNTSSHWIERYVQHLTNPIGIGIKCIGDNRTRQSSCAEISLIKDDNITLSNKTYSDCSCEAGKITCPKNATYDTLPRIVLGSGHEVINVTNINVTKWILNSWESYGSIRTGGFTFGLKLPTKGMSLSTVFEDIKKEKQRNMDVNEDDNDQVLTDNIVIWFNNKWPISPVAYLNGINNVILRASLPDDEAHKYGIRLTVHAMNYTTAQYHSEIMLKGAVALLHSVSLIFSLSLIPTAFILYLIEERITNSKHLQFLSGVNWMIYWIQAFTWDMVCYFIATLFCITALMIFGTEMYVNKSSFPCLFILILLYGWANIPFMYPASFFFQVSSSAFVTLSCINLLIGLTTTATTYVLRILKDEYLSTIEITLRKILLIFPHFCLGEGVMKLAEMYLLTTSLSKYNVKVNFDLYSWDYLGKNYISLFLEGIVFFIFTLFYEKFNNQGLCPKHLVSLNPPEILDDDVKEERKRILKSRVGDVLVLKCLTKVYKPRNFIAVNQICLGVNSGQCFGLLGLNGAGKTTTFMMLTGATNISFGDASVKGVSIRKDMSSVSSCIGYCPQTDALDPKLTPQEHLEMYARLRNIPIDDIKLVVTKTLITFDLERYKDVSTKYLSGGNKRKLSTAIAILGYPDVVYLDEPTSGMDPKGRRFLWARIREIVVKGHAVVLTTHNMHECEALCSRVTIMANGQLMCLGTIQHIKNKFGQGYNLVVWSSFDNIPKIEELFTEILPEAILKSSHHTQIKYYLPIETFCLSKVLGHLENLKKNKLAYDYSLSQKTLDEIFLHFVTKHTIKEECIDYHNCSCFQTLTCKRSENIINSREESEKFVMKV